MCFVLVHPGFAESCIGTDRPAALGRAKDIPLIPTLFVQHDHGGGKENVLVQPEHLKTHPAVAKRLRMGDLNLHGWIYSIATGEVWLYDSLQKTFVFPKEVNKGKDS